MTLYSHTDNQNAELYISGNIDEDETTISVNAKYGVVTNYLSEASGKQEMTGLFSTTKQSLDGNTYYGGSLQLLGSSSATGEMVQRVSANGYTGAVVADYITARQSVTAGAVKTAAGADLDSLNSNLAKASVLTIQSYTVSGMTDDFGNIPLNTTTNYIYFHVINVCCTSHHAIACSLLRAGEFWYARLLQNTGTHTPLAGASVTLRVEYLTSQKLIS